MIGVEIRPEIPYNQNLPQSLTVPAGFHFYKRAGMEKEKKILVVEDDDHLRRLITLALEREKYLVFAASDGSQAIGDAAKLHPDLVVLDLMLPGKDGIEVCRRLKASAETKDIKIIMMTAQKNSVVRSAGLANGADFFMNKPFNLSELVEKIEAIVN